MSNSLRKGERGKVVLQDLAYGVFTLPNGPHRNLSEKMRVDGKCFFGPLRGHSNYYSPTTSTHHHYYISQSTIISPSARTHTLPCLLILILASHNRHGLVESRSSP